MEQKSLIESPPTLPIFFTFFLSVYLIAYFIVFRNWTPTTRPEASSCLISLFHGTPAALLAARALFSDPTRGFPSPNTEFQNMVLEYSVAYFLTDIIHYLLFYPSDILFIAHHLATLFVFITCRYVVHHGAYAVLVLLFLAEVTSACQNTWTLARARRGDSVLALRVHDMISLPFYGVYSVVRGFMGPWFVFKMVVAYASGVASGVIPTWVWVSWVGVVGMAISVSILWVSNLWVELYTERWAIEKKKV